MFISKKMLSIPYSKYRQLQSNLRQKRKELILFLEHKPVITAGKNFLKENLLVTEIFLEENKIDFLEVERGGDLTAHEKGQLVIYPHIDILKRKISISDFLKGLNESLIESIYETWKLETYSHKEKPGIYISKSPEKKILSQGIYFKSNFTSFGVALNISNDLKLFNLINPCGGDSKNIVSISSLGLEIKKENDFILEFRKRFLKFIR